MKIKITSLFFIVFTLPFFGQLDSLYTIVKTSKIDSVRADAHYELGWLLKLNDLPAATAHTDTALVVYKNLKSTKKVALCHFQLSVLYRLSGDLKKALVGLDKYQQYVVSVNDENNIAYVFNEKGVIYTQMGNYEQGLTQFYKAIEIAEKTENYEFVGHILNSIGIVYKDLERYHEAMASFEKAITIYNENEISDESLGDVNNNLGDVFLKQGIYDKAEEYYILALHIYREAESEWGVALINMNLGLLLATQEKYRPSLFYLDEAYKIQKENNYKTDFALTLSNLGMVYLELGNYAKSEAFLKEGLALKSDNKASTKELYFEMYRLNQKRNDFKNALYYHKEYVLFKDSIFNEENTKNIHWIKTQFETEKKDKELAKQELEIQKTSTQFNYLVGLSAFLLVSILLLWFLFKQRQKRKNQEIVTLKREHQIKTLESLIEGEEKERFRIAKELHDGVNGDLSAIKYKLSSLLEMNNKVIKEAITMIDDSCQQVRTISHNLVPQSLENFNLEEAIQEYCNSMDAIHQPKIIFQKIGEHIKIDKKSELNIFRIIQELVSNSIKHSEASEIIVQISCRDSLMHITFEDDGKGFDVNQIESDGIGLKNIQSRIEYLHGSMDLISNENGTSYTIEIDTNNLNDH
ncbi:MAG: sensor histidine kinase [Urechidicola sp.]|nr:sensor histidine kinase [Urechidicola sp.]